MLYGWYIKHGNAGRFTAEGRHGVELPAGGRNCFRQPNNGKQAGRRPGMDAPWAIGVVFMALGVLAGC